MKGNGRIKDAGAGKDFFFSIYETKEERKQTEQLLSMAL